MKNSGSKQIFNIVQGIGYEILFAMLLLGWACLVAFLVSVFYL